MKQNLRRLHIHQDAADLPLGRLDDDPEYVSEAAVLAHLEAARRRSQMAADAARLRRDLNPGDLDGRNGTRRQDSARMLERLDRELTSDTGHPKINDVIADALRLAGDDAELPAETPSVAEQERRHGVRDEMLRKAISAQQEKVAAIVGELSARHAEQIRPDHEILLRDVLASAEAFAAAVNAERQFRVETIVNGRFEWRPDLTPAPTLRGSVVLGDPANASSELAQYRQLLTLRGVI